MIRFIIGIVLILSGAFLGLYVGGWFLFIGGITEIFNEIQTTPISGEIMAVNIFRVLIAGFVGWIVFYLLCIPGLSMILDIKPKRSRKKRRL